jgi:hypothetical protein
VKGKYADLYVIGFVDYIDQFAERRLAQLRHAIWIVDPRKIRDQIICLKSGYDINNFKQNDCQRFTEFPVLAFILLLNCYTHTKIAALEGKL